MSCTVSCHHSHVEDNELTLPSSPGRASEPQLLWPVSCHDLGSYLHTPTSSSTHSTIPTHFHSHQNHQSRQPAAFLCPHPFFTLSPYDDLRLDMHCSRLVTYYQHHHASQHPKPCWQLDYPTTPPTHLFPNLQGTNCTSHGPTPTTRITCVFFFLFFSIALFCTSFQSGNDTTPQGDRSGWRESSIWRRALACLEMPIQQSSNPAFHMRERYGFLLFFFL